MGWRNDQCRKVCRILDDVLANRPTERDSLIVAVRKAFDELPSAEPDITTHDSIPAETGKNDGDRTSDDCISRQQAIDAADRADYTGLAVEDVKKVTDEVVKELKQLPSVQPDIIRCKDCKHWNPQLKTANGNGLGSCDFHNVALVTSEGFCYWAERGEQNDPETD